MLSFRTEVLYSSICAFMLIHSPEVLSLVSISPISLGPHVLPAICTGLTPTAPRHEIFKKYNKHGDMHILQLHPSLQRVVSADSSAQLRISGVQICAKTLQHCCCTLSPWCSSLWLPAELVVHKNSDKHQAEFNLIEHHCH